MSMSFFMSNVIINIQQSTLTEEKKTSSFKITKHHVCTVQSHSHSAKDCVVKEDIDTAEREESWGFEKKSKLKIEDWGLKIRSWNKEVKVNVKVKRLWIELKLWMKLWIKLEAREEVDSVQKSESESQSDLMYVCMSVVSEGLSEWEREREAERIWVLYCDCHGHQHC